MSNPKFSSFGVKQTLRGSTLIEVLVTMIVISLGLLGQAALIAQSSKASNAALAHSQATMLAYDILERIRLNRTAAVNGNFTTALTAAASSFTGTQIYQTELKNWKTNVENSLNGGQASIAVTANGTTAPIIYTVTITIKWNEVVKGLAGDTSVPTTTFVTESVI